ncbi:hypothetical protein A0J52_17675 [Clostridium sporogenes]|uniref:hypothetical protein n=1 Tax=Clostridium sporogenes TaxID=1509 RepID=UPI0007801206|nr:hypothetical protein [Clostridium sporogenes]KYN75802.1 hypothetical protein A0J52_17675 [Clostridium sporogenes]
MRVANICRAYNKLNHKNKKLKKDISQKVITEKIDKIKEFLLQNDLKINNNFFKNYIRPISTKNFNVYTGLIFLVLISLYDEFDDFRLLFRYKPINDINAEDYLVYAKRKIIEYLNPVLEDEYIVFSRKNKKFIDTFNWGEKWREDNMKILSYIINELTSLIFKLCEFNRQIMNLKVEKRYKKAIDLLYNIDSLPLYRKFKFLNKCESIINKIELLSNELINDMKNELRKCITNDNIEMASTIVSELEEYEQNILIKKSYWIDDLVQKINACYQRYNLQKPNINSNTYNLSNLFIQHDNYSTLKKTNNKSFSILKSLEQTTSLKEILLLCNNNEIDKLNNLITRKKDEEMIQYLNILKCRFDNKRILSSQKDENITIIKKSYKFKNSKFIITMLENKPEYKMLEDKENMIYKIINKLIEKSVNERNESLLEKAFFYYTISKKYLL